jgi:hypothetical protein
MPILDIVQLILSIIVTVAPTFLAAMKEKRDVKKSAFDLGLTELHAADERMRLDAREHPRDPVQP